MELKSRLPRQKAAFTRAAANFRLRGSPHCPVMTVCNPRHENVNTRRKSGWTIKTAARSPRARNGKTQMAADRSQNLQDTFLNHVRKSKMPLTIFLVNGVKLQGVVTWFDNFCVLLRRDGHSQLVYKHAISTIMPGHPIQLFEGAEEASIGEKG
jgi:host factor-I protein